MGTGTDFSRDELRCSGNCGRLVNLNQRLSVCCLLFNTRFCTDHARCLGNLKENLLLLRVIAKIFIVLKHLETFTFLHLRMTNFTACIRHNLLSVNNYSLMFQSLSTKRRRFPILSNAWICFIQYCSFNFKGGAIC